MLLTALKVKMLWNAVKDNAYSDTIQHMNIDQHERDCMDN